MKPSTFNPARIALARYARSDGLADGVEATPTSAYRSDTRGRAVCGVAPSSTVPLSVRHGPAPGPGSHTILTACGVRWSHVLRTCRLFATGDTTDDDYVHARMRTGAGSDGATVESHRSPDSLHDGVGHHDDDQLHGSRGRHVGLRGCGRVRERDRDLRRDSPSYSLNRRWTWGRRDRSNVWSEVLPFWMLAFCGLALSTATVGIVDSWARHMHLTPMLHTAAILVGHLSGFGLLWVLQFVLLDRVLFGIRSGAAAPRIDG